MPGFDGTGPSGMGPMTGGGRGFCRPRGVIPRQYAFPHPAYYSFPQYGTHGFRPFTPRLTREQELEFLKGQADALRDELKGVEAEIGKLSADKK
ncbi:MAG TPA: DUF5320 domain-containing protein [Dehalococcoidia bacterium]|nr:DUF5320 domain-containing protein [Dehalococcoidia bacterium]